MSHREGPEVPSNAVAGVKQVWESMMPGRAIDDEVVATCVKDLRGRLDAFRRDEPSAEGDAIMDFLADLLTPYLSWLHGASPELERAAAAQQARAWLPAFQWVLRGAGCGTRQLFGGVLEDADQLERLIAQVKARAPVLALRVSDRGQGAAGPGRQQHQPSRKAPPRHGSGRRSRRRPGPATRRPR
ncbi:unnamed protein product [Prorocentrum cordatum]|uniref:Uncharacterized protein n=1 Tax=Prorocentrum cordatum TaxID=2364126 RepID=A0ABN9TRB2_9DINO|nr:unnamed protein product [Polarella glacialis]